MNGGPPTAAFNPLENFATLLRVHLTITEAVMTRNHDPFIHALSSLRDRVVGGQFRPGQPIVILEEAKRLDISPTPVREALAWLSGEGLVQRAASGGYFAPPLTAAVIRDRYRFRLMCLMSALKLDPTLSVGAGVQSPLPTAPVFDRIVERSGSPTLTDAYRRVASLLSVLEPAELRLIPDLASETQALDRLHAAPGAPGLIEALIAFHQRRVELAAVLLVSIGVDSSQPDRPS